MIQMLMSGSLYKLYSIILPTASGSVQKTRDYGSATSRARQLRVQHATFQLHLGILKNFIY